ncbi:oxidoreductase [Methylotenera oryzisoli]|uniref:Oxidoreductase n=1 Tax=Methylotenera oryzisoli TaxID=2080758 RepID=A0A4Y9VSK8_9PROT|nr:phage tail protein [Methylotenera oryzisoli]TFW71503.1 oxidoreductase [Methylotenera oryzisoli]
MMMSLGLFVFSMDTLPYQKLTHEMAWRHPSAGRVGLRPARQFAGVDDETINLSGVLLPEVSGGDLSLDLIRHMGDTGEQWPLVEGTGRVYGFFVIEKLSVNKELFFSDGKARRIEFSLNLTRVGDDQLDKIGAINDKILDFIR